MKTLLLFFLLNTFAFAAYQSGWTASFKMTSSATSSGYSVGTVAWRWSEGDQANLQTRFEFQLKYQNPNNGFTSTELYQYNSNGGYQTTDSEYKYTDDTACNPSCSTSGIAATYPAMPPMDPNLVTSGSVTGATSFWSTAPSNPGSSAYTCQKFVPKTASIVSSFTASRTAAGAITICGFVISDGCITRTYTLSSFSSSVPTITPPAGCSCNSVLDIMLVIDHSGSITPVETRLFHQFVVNFLASLNIATNSVNVGIVWFHGAHTVNNGIQVGLNGPTGNYNDVVIGTSNCTGTGTTIGTCATPSSQVPPWQTPCTPGTVTTNECASSQGNTCTSGGVLLGSSLLFSSGQNRKVPKLFITMTDGAVNTLVGNSVASTPWTSTNGAVPCGGGSCSILSDSNNCTTELKTTMNTVKTQYNQWLSRVGCTATQCPLTLLSVGIGIPFYSYCDPASPQTQPYTDPWSGKTVNWIDSFCSTIGGQKVCHESSHCLSNQHLDILAGGNGNYGNVNPNVLAATDWVTLNQQFLPKLLALSCPDNSFTACACESSCAGFCSGACNSCNPPTGCTPSNNKCYQIVQSNTSSGSSCIQQTIPNVCPATTCNCNNCTSYTCDSTANGGLGACVAKTTAATSSCPPVLQANGSVSCVTSQCNVQTGVCDIKNYNGCPVCQNATGSCVGASCGVNGTQTTTLIAGVDYCRGLGNTSTQSCCAPCDCTVGAWTSWNNPCLASGCGVAGAGTATRSRTITPATCGGDDAQCAAVPLTDSQNCTDCTPVPCNYTYGQWSCNCSSGIATSPVIIITPPKNNGTACPVDNTTTCQCCADQWTSTACSCDTHTYSRTWSITVNASGPGATGCTTPDPTSYTGLVCTPEGCGNLTLCSTADDCNDFNACTLDICDTNNGATVAKHCRNVDNSSSCNTNSVCFTGSCDITLGCLVAPALNCNDDSVCTNDWCDDVLGCQHNASNISTSCKAPTDCNTAFCDPFAGCQFANIQCNASNDNCSVSGCDPNWNNASYANNHLCKCSNPKGPCYTENVCGVPLALVVGLTAGGIAGVVVAAAICAFACVSGTTYAATQLVNSDDQVLTTANPLFQADGTTGVNAAR